MIDDGFSSPGCVPRQQVVDPRRCVTGERRNAGLARGSSCVMRNRQVEQLSGPRRQAIVATPVSLMVLLAVARVLQRRAVAF
jgi:hypothetical protein